MIDRQLLGLPVVGLLFASLVWAADNPAPETFVSLFNGKNLDGWKVPDGDNGHWKVVDGVIDYDAGSEAKGDKALWSEREYGDFILQLDWRLKEAPFLNKNVAYILPDGTHAKDIHGNELKLTLPDADSGVYLRGDGWFQVNIWCWPIGSGEMYSVRMDPKTPPDVRAAVTPRTRADEPVGEWNHFEIEVRGQVVKVKLNGTTVIPGATIPGLPSRGRIALQHHGSKNKDGTWNAPPSLVQFKNIWIKELPPSGAAIQTGGANRQQEPGGPVRGLVVTGGHDHETSFYTLFEGHNDLGSMPVASSSTAFQSDLRGKYDVVIMYDFSRDLNEAGKKNLRDFVESGKGIVVLHHALLNYQEWPWWYQETVGGRYRLKPEGGHPASSVKNNQQIDVTPEGEHPVTAGIGAFQIEDETYKGMYFSPQDRPLLTTTNPNSDRVLAWIGPCTTSRVVAIQLGHGPTAHRNPSYRALVHNAILWAAGRTKLGLSGEGAAPQKTRNLLVIGQSKGYEHDSVSTAMATLQHLGRASNRWNTYFRTDCTAITKKPRKWGAKNLDAFDAVAFFTDGNLDMDDSQKADLLSFVHEDGKGFIGIHSATITFLGWPEYGKMIGGYFDGHPWGEFDAPLLVEDARFPGMRHLPDRFTLKDEIYQIKDFSRNNVRVLLRLDAAKTDLSRKGVHRKDGDFAVVWARNYGKGRVLYNGLGHRPEVWERPEFQKMWVEMVQWSFGDTPGDATPRPAPAEVIHTALDRKKTVEIP